MALVIPPNHYQALIPIRHDRVLRPAAITLGVRDETFEGDPSAVANQVQSSYVSAFGNAMDSETTMGPTIVTFDQGENGRGSVSGTTETNGTRASGVATTSNIALLVRKISDRVGRPGRGRMFIPWVLSQSSVDEVGNITPTAVTDMQDRADAFLTSLQTAGLQMVILHDSTVPNATPASLVIGLNVDSVVATQRRRLRA